MTKALKQSAKVRTNPTPGSVCKVQIDAVKFADLWSGYPKTGTPYLDSRGNVPTGYENQCAIRVSVSLGGAGLTMKSFKGSAVTVSGKKAAVRAQEMADWLKLQPFCGLPTEPEDITGEGWQGKIKGRTGIVFFKDYWQRQGERNATGDHIDLWNGSKMTATGAMIRAHAFMRFTLGIDSFFGMYSDLGKSTQILFWEIK